ncbi:MAG: PCMD domain-containing protein [Parabacteroides merdae]
MKKDEQDECLIYIALSTKQHEVISKTGQIVPYPFDDESVFAYGSYVSGKTEDKTGETLAESIKEGYAPFKIKLNYKTAVPKTGSFYILIVATSSRYGEYFTGSTSSVMYVDEFSLDYDYDAEAFSGTDLKGMKPVDINE